MSDREEDRETDLPQDEVGERRRRKNEQYLESDETDDIKIINRELPKLITDQQVLYRPPRRNVGPFIRVWGPWGKVFGWFSKSITTDNMESLLIEIIVVWLIWAIMWSFLGENALPGSYVFGIAILTSMSYFVKAIISAFTNFFPGHFMIGVGILARHTFLPELKDMKNNYPIVLDYTKRIAYVVFLLRAGLGTNIIHVKHNSDVIVRLICVHSVVKVTYVCLVTKYALGIPWDWAALAGVMLEPSSPMHIFTIMSRLREQGYAPHHEIHSSIIFSTILDGLLMLCCSVTFIIQACTKRGWWGAPLVSIPAQLLIGMAFGLSVGFVGIYVPSNNNAHSDIYRCLYFVTSSFFFIFALADDYIGAGFLAAYLSPLVASTGWKHLNYYASVVRMRNVTSLLWSWTQPFLFAVIGAEINIKFLGETRRLIFVGVYFTSLMINVGASVLATLKTDYSWKLRLLIWLSKIPKGSIEVAVGFWIILAVKEHFPKDEVQMDRAQLIIDCCVLAFFISGPVGGFLIDFVAQKVLKEENTTETPQPDNLEDDLRDRVVSLPSEEGKKHEETPSQQIV